MIVLTLRVVAAGLLLAGGAVHYRLWEGGYRNVPTIGSLFLLSVIGSVAVAGGVLLGRRGVAGAVTGIAFALGSLAALGLSRTVGLFGFTEMIWSPDAIGTLVTEAGAIAALGVVLVLQITGSRRTRSAELVPVRIR